MVLKNLNNLEKRIKSDKRIIFIFVFFLISTMILSVGSALFSSNLHLVVLINNIFNGLSLSFLLTGLYSAYCYWNRRLTRFRRIIIYIIVLSAVLSLGVLIYLNFFNSNADINISSIMLDNKILTLISLHISISLGLIIASLFIIIMGFGAIGLMSAVVRIRSREIFNDIKNISRYTDEDTKDENRLQYLYHKILGWFFSIPYVLDTSKFYVQKPKLTEKISKKQFKTAILWELFFCMIISVNISLNPFLLEYLSISELFALTSGIATFIPIIILPWFTYHELNAKIKGPHKDFSLYEGLKNRVFEILVTVGTLYTFLRLSLKEVALDSLIRNFLTYISGIILLVLLFTYVYFNFFENDLISDVYKSYEGSD